jgi:hypothetical protein
MLFRLSSDSPDYRVWRYGEGNQATWLSRSDICPILVLSWNLRKTDDRKALRGFILRSGIVC